MGARRVLRGVVGAGLAEYDEMEGSGWEWQAIDGVVTKAPLGKDATGKNPTDRAKSGTKRSMLTDGAGMPLSVAIEGTNRHDAKLLVATLEGLMVARCAWKKEDEQQHMCLDAAYDSEPVREELKEGGNVPHICPADKKEREREGAVHRHGGRARRWVVERTHSWLNRSRRLPVRWEKKAENYLVFIQLARAQLILFKITVYG
jgi:putative transposase